MNGLNRLAESLDLCHRRGGEAGSGPGDLSPTMRIREACRRDRRSAAADRPLLLDVLGPRPMRPACGGLRRLMGRLLRAITTWIKESD